MDTNEEKNHNGILFVRKEELPYDFGTAKHTESLQDEQSTEQMADWVKG